MNRFNKLLTVILIIVVVGAIVAFGFWIFDIIKDKKEEAEIQDLENQFLNQVAVENTVGNTIDVNLSNQIVENTTVPNPQPNITPQPSGGNGGNGGNGGGSGSSSGNSIPLKYKGYNVIGWISIPKTNVSYPVLSKSSLFPSFFIFEFFLILYSSNLILYFFISA